VYGGLTAGVIVVALLRASLFFWATIVAATRMHNSMILRVLRAPLSFFHTNPAGRVLNRFSNDQVGFGMGLLGFVRAVMTSGIAARGRSRLQVSTGSPSCAFLCLRRCAAACIWRLSGCIQQVLYWPDT
jgi:ABC-type multidrug transport system fused ATPase/permease subunit